MISALKILTPKLSAISCASRSILTSNAKITAYLKKKNIEAHSVKSGVAHRAVVNTKAAELKNYLLRIMF